MPQKSALGYTKMRLGSGKHCTLPPYIFKDLMPFRFEPRIAENSFCRAEFGKAFKQKNIG
tara:strand:+ start:165 stop:344 length:180 start_codon:yes stop_codon:yes gene_type:complete